jgi:hypothetical protein
MNYLNKYNELQTFNNFLIDTYEYLKNLYKKLKNLKMTEPELIEIYEELKEKLNFELYERYNRVYDWPIETKYKELVGHLYQKKGKSDIAKSIHKYFLIVHDYLFFNIYLLFEKKIKRYEELGNRPQKHLIIKQRIQYDYTYIINDVRGLIKYNTDPIDRQELKALGIEEEEH